MSHRRLVAAFLMASAGSSLALLSGCSSGPPVSGVVYVDTAPPPDQIEVIGVAPSGEHTWIPGHYSWSGNSYAWVGGHWEARPRHQARWVKGHWRRHNNRWYWVEGRWK